VSSSVQYRIVHWLWQRPALAARAARVALLPLAFGYGVIVRLRAAAYRRGWLRTGRLPLPTVSIGNRSVGGTGKTPLAAWVARHYLRSEEHTSELQSPDHLVCRLLLEKKKKQQHQTPISDPRT